MIRLFDFPVNYSVFFRSKKSEASTQLSSINCLKLIGAFLVVCLHCFPKIFWSNTVVYYVYPLFRMAIPLFLIISGYFLYDMDKVKFMKKCKRALVKMLWITLFANIFYFITNPIYFDDYASALRFIFIGGSSYHLWYLNTYIETLLCLMLFLKLRKIKGLLLLSPFFYLLGLCLGTYSIIFNLNPSSDFYRNFITIGIPCVGAGYLLKQYQEKIIYLFSRPLLLFLFILLLSEIEAFILRTYLYSQAFSGDFYVCSILLGVSTVILAIKYPWIGNNTLIDRLGKNKSLLIYIFHVIVLRKINVYFQHYQVDLSPYLLPLLVFVVTLIFVNIWQKASEKIFIGYIYRQPA